MIDLKTDYEIVLMQKAGEILRQVLDEIVGKARPGLTTKELDQNAEALIKQKGGLPGFKKVKGYRWATCMPVNDQVVHSPPSDRKLKNGDVLTVDCGVFYQGFHTDAAETIMVGTDGAARYRTFLDVGKRTLQKAIDEVTLGKRIGHISAAIEKGIKAPGYYVIRELTGHGVGRQLHEDPLIPGILDKSILSTPEIAVGMVLAIEVIYAVGTDKIIHESGDNWSIKTADGSVAACFERTVAVTSTKTLILA